MQINFFKSPLLKIKHMKQISKVWMMNDSWRAANPAVSDLLLTAEARQADETNAYLGETIVPLLCNPLSVLFASEESCVFNRARVCVVLHTAYSLRFLSSSSQQE